MITMKKPDGTTRICIDFKRINAIMTPLPFYMPRVEEVLEQIGNNTVISKLDLAKGYYQVPMKEEDICKTAFVSHREKHKFLRMPFRVRNTPAVFQALMTRLFSECKHYYSPYMDDVVINSRSWEEHRIHVKEVLSRLKGAGLTATQQSVYGEVRRYNF